MKALFSALGGYMKAERAWLTLLLVASAAGFIYWKFATVERDRDALLGFARVACATAGAQFDGSIEAPPNGKGKAVKHPRGQLCNARLLELAAFERDATKASNQALADGIRDHNMKSAADAKAAALDAAAAEAALRRMEKQDNEIGKENRVGGNWFRALNELAGVRGTAGR